MRITSWPLAALLFSSFVLSACSGSDSVDSVWRSGKMEVISTRYHYGTESGRQYWRSLSLKIDGSDIEDREISEKLFPKTSPCFSPLYRISDVRPLKDESVLALLSVHESGCGKAQLARLSVERGKLRVQHLDLSPFSKERSGTEAVAFEDVHPRDVAPDTPYLDVQLAAQRDTRTEWVTVQVRQEVERSEFSQKRTIAIHLADHSLHDLGLGNLIRFHDDDSVALMSHGDRRDSGIEHVQYRAVRPVDSAVLHRIDLRLACFALADPAGVQRAMSDLDLVRMQARRRVEMLEQAIKEGEAITTSDPKFPGVIDSLKTSAATAARELADWESVTREQVISGKGLRRGTRWAHDAAVTDLLLDDEKTLVAWNAGQGRLELRIDAGLARDPQCED